MIIVLDASAAVGIALNNPGLEDIEKNFKKAEYIITPDIFISEVTNTIWKYHQFEDFPVNDCEYLLGCAINLVDDFIDSKSLHKEAFALSCQVGHPIYDILYLITTRRHSGYLLTLDKKLKKIANKQSIKII